MLQDFLNRRSVRRYTGETVPADKLEQVLHSALTSASGHAWYPCEYIVVKDKDVLAKMSECRAGGSAAMLKGADCAVVVLGDESKSDMWMEDCSISMANMMVMATSLGLGSCWIQGRARTTADGETTENYLRGLLGYPENMRLEAILSLGVPETVPAPRTVADLKVEKIHNANW